MVNLQICNEAEKANSTKLSAASCSEVAQASIRRNGTSHDSSKVPVVNGDCKASLDDTPLVNGSCKKTSENGLVGSCKKAKSVKNGPVINGNCSSNFPTNNLQTDIKKDNTVESELPRINGNHDDKIAEAFPVVNGNDEEKPAVELPIVNENHDKVTIELPTVNGNHEKAAVELPMESGIHDHKTTFEELPTVGGAYNTDDSSSPSENGSFKNDCDENLTGFVTVINKKKLNRDRYRKKANSNLPPIKKTENIHREVIDKNKIVKTSPVHLAQKPPSRTVFPVRNLEKSYSSALVNGQSKMSQTKSTSQTSSDSQSKAFLAVTKGPKINKPSSNNPESSETPGQLPLATLAISSQPNSATKVEKNDFSGQTDISSENELSHSQTECLPSQEDEFSAKESIKASSPINYLDVDYLKEITEESNIAYSESVISNDSGRGDSEGSYDVTFRCQFPRIKVPLLIGRRGNYKREVEGKSGARIRVINIYSREIDFAIVEIKGTLLQIEIAKSIIQERFPDILLQHYDITESDLIGNSYMPTLPSATKFFGIVSSIYNPNSFWVQQYGHPLYYQLEDLERRMSQHYNTILDAPAVDYPVANQIVAVAGSTNSNNEAVWLRGMIVNVFPNAGNVLVRYLDHGGEYVIPVTGIRQIRHEFFTMPFFAAECCLYGVQPIGPMWSQEAVQEFVRLCYVSHHPTFKVISQTEQCYYVSMETYDSTLNTSVDFASVLIQKGLANPYTECGMGQPPNAAEQ